VVGDGGRAVVLTDVVVVMRTTAAAICSMGHGLRTFTFTLLLVVGDGWCSVVLADVVVVMWAAAAAICSIGHGLRTFTTSRTYAVLAVGDGWRSVVLADVVVVMRTTAADGKHEVIAVGRRVAEPPVVWIAGRSRSLERERENASVVAQRRIHDVLYGVGRRLRVPA